MKIKKGDTVIVISGKDKGKKGKVLHAYPRQDQILVEGVNVKKKHQKPTKNNPKGQILDKTFPIHVSNAMVQDPKDKKPTRVGYQANASGKARVRVAKRSGTVL